MNPSYTREDIIFYLDLTKNLLRKKDVLKAIKYYIEEKNKENIKSHYGILIFQEEGNPTFITDKKDSDIISKAIDENWKSRPKDTSFFENGLFYILSYIAETVIRKKKNNRIIIITDTPSDLNEEYQEALFNLISKVKYFPTFIDIIRIIESDTRFQKDDVKLNILVSDTKGGLFYVHDKKEFLSVVKKLIKNKQIVNIFTDKPNTFEIDEEDYAFYNKLAKHLIIPDITEEKKCYFCQKDICPICNRIDDTPKKCEDCGTTFHNCCITDYSIDNNIGIPHIFRCPSCQILLQIDESSIVEDISSTPDISLDQVKSIPQLEGEKDLEKTREVETTKIEPKILEIKEPEVQTKPNQFIVEENASNVRKVRIGGFFGRTYQLNKVGDKIVYKKAQGSIPSQTELGSGIENGEHYWKPKSSANRRSHKIRFCSECGAAINSINQKICHKCGIELK